MFKRKRSAKDFAEEIEAHLALEAEELRRGGVSEEEARRQARVLFGNVRRAEERFYLKSRVEWLDNLASDLRFAVRSAWRTPLLTVVVLLALSIGIGLNVGVFSILNAMFLASPTRVDPASFVQIYPRYEGWFAGAAKLSAFNSEDFDAIHANARTLRDVAAWSRVSVTFNDLHRQDTSLLINCNYFHVFGMDRLIMGRLFLPNECEPGTQTRVLVISEHVWRNLYASDPQIVGKAIRINGQPFVVVGVAADSSASLIPGGVWMPYTLEPLFSHSDSAFHDPNSVWLSVAARLNQGFSRSDARAEIEAILRQRDRLYVVQKAFARDRKTSVEVTNGSFIENPAVRTVATGLMTLIMGPVLLVLFLACTNVTTLFLSRSIVRRGELAVRLSLGAGRARLMRMLAIESLLTAAVAGVAATVLAVRIPSLLMGTLDPEGRLGGSIRPDWRVFAYLTFLIVTAAAVSALAPMRESFQFDLVTALKGREGAVTARSGTTGALIVVQLAMSFVLLVAAVLFARMPSTIEGIDLGFETRHLMKVPLEINVPPFTTASAAGFYRTLEARILGIPGVQSLAYASISPFDLTQADEVRLENQAQGQGRSASIDRVSADFFSTFSIPVLHGRAFLHSDDSASGTAHVAVVSQAFAREFWAGGDPIDKAIVTPDGRRLLVVGVAADTRSERFGILDGPRVYVLRDHDPTGSELFIRFKGDAAPFAKQVEETVKSIDPSQDDTPATIWDYLEANATQIRALARIVTFMAAIAVALATTGLYAVLSFAMNRRTREFAIQMMLGATRESIFGSVMLQSAKQIAMGLVCGTILAFPAAWTFARMTEKSTFPIHTFDVSVYCISAVILLVVSVGAMSFPGLRAMRVDPMQALRCE